MPLVELQLFLYYWNSSPGRSDAPATPLYEETQMVEQGTVVQSTPEVPYEPPIVTCLGEVREFVLGDGSQDTADMNTSRYW